MMQLELIKNFFPAELRENASFQKYMLKEYIQLLIKLESEDQQIIYKPAFVNIKGCGFYFPFPVPSDGVLCSMKISAMLSRQKGRDFYDAMFLLAQSQPDYFFLIETLNIHNLEELKSVVVKTLKTVDLNMKKRDFEHLLFNKRSSGRILSVGEFFQDLK